MSGGEQEGARGGDAEGVWDAEFRESMRQVDLGAGARLLQGK